MFRKTIWAVFAVLAICASGMPCAAAEDAPAHEDKAAAGDHGHETHPGDPSEEFKQVPHIQEDLGIYTFCVFLLLVAVLGKFAWKPITQALDERESRIHKHIADTEAGHAKVEQMIAEHSAKLDAAQDEVREIIAEARRDAEHTKQTIVEEARSEAEALKDRAVGEIERARDAALNELFSHMANNVAQATEHVLGRAISGDDQSRLIGDALAEITEQAS